MSSTLKKIESNTNSSMGSLKQTFTKVQGAMLNLGHAAQAVHNIFQTRENILLKLEMATNRLENAEINLKQATQGLTAAQRKLSDIERSHERDSLNLERAQLRLADAQKEANFAIKFYGEDSRQAKDASLALKEAQFDLADAQRASAEKTQQLSDAQQEIIDKQDGIVKATNNVENAMAKKNKVMKDVFWAYFDMGVQIATLGGNLAVLLPTLWALPPVQKAIAFGMTEISVAGAPVWIILLGIAAAIAAIVIAYKEWNKVAAGGKNSMALGIVGNMLARASGKKGSKQSGGPIAATGMYQLHAGEYVVPKRETGGRSVVVNIENVYGMNPRQISEALSERLRYRGI